MAFRELLHARDNRSGLLIGLVLGVLGFALVAQVKTTQTAAFPAAREEDLVRILDDLANRGDRLRTEIDELRRTRDRLGGGLNRNAAALQEARRRADVLGVLAGTLPAEGPGLVLVLRDPKGTVEADVVLDVIQELRDAGAEAIMVNRQRIVTSSYVVDHATGVAVDGTELVAPYTFVVIGDPPTLAEAMKIPGGVVDLVASRDGAAVSVESRSRVVVDALRPLPSPQYARPSASQGG